MYYIRRNNKFLFLVTDLMALSLTYILSFDFQEKSKDNLYFFIVMNIIGVLVALMSEEYWTISERGYLKEFKSTSIYVLKIVSLFTLFLVIFNRKDFFNIVESLELIIYLVLAFVFIYCVRTVSKKINNRYRDDSRNIIILSDFSDLDTIGELPDNYEVLAYANTSKDDFYNDKPVVHNISEIRDFVSDHKVDEIYANLSSQTSLIEIFKIFEILGIPTKINITPIIKEIGANTVVTFQGDNIYLTSAIKIATLRQVILKRVMDIAISIVGILLTILVGLIILPIVKKQAPGPLIFTQTRIGQNGDKFKIYKFRSMYVDAEERKAKLLSQNELETTLMFKMENDPRVFPFGQKLRDWSLDELPQFINVLKGDMSVVGTRPPTVDEYTQYDLHHFKRMQVKPGITGMWQVSGRSNILDFEEVVKLDMKYIENWSLRQDIKIILKTIMVVLKRE
ncbi:MAG: sugar transferase [Gemella haemolysans]|nr:sugar transferase [Gemella haemolysans]